ncbi:MAG: SDR family oxidoreductase [Candidatus Eremiobacteraeota bacterium]|nr:SDR family oxidoreductase [Candidatus Eremiobacteraeota bacterium]
MIDLQGKIALVTGASRGIGRACAVRLAEAGATVVVNYLNSPDLAREVAREISTAGGRAAVVKADVSEPEDVASMLAFVGERFGQLDILVSNVASGGFRPLMATSPVQFQATMNVNVIPLLTLVQSARPWLEKAGGRAKVVALSSHGSRRALEAYGAIGASKAALESLSRHLALELGSRVNFNVVLAGLVQTDATSSFPDEVFERARAGMMLNGRSLTARDVADAVLFLASPLSDLIQAQTLVVDGGFDSKG